MSISDLKTIEISFNSTISHILETAECTFGKDERWPLYRKMVLKRINELKREVLEATQGKGKVRYETSSNFKGSA